MKPLALASLFSLLTFVPSSVVAKDPPPFAGQTHVNGALAEFNKAKEKVATDASTALKHLNAAHGHLTHAQQNKGIYQDLAEALSAQAIQLLKAGKPQDALRKVDNAIDLISKAAAQRQFAVQKK
jgi:hypothetical protein